MQKNTKIHKYTKIQKLHKYKNTIIQEYNYLFSVLMCSGILHFSILVFLCIFVYCVFL